MSDSDLKVTDRRWWARADEGTPAEEPKLTPKHVEELEAAADRADDPVVQGVSLVRQQCLSTRPGHLIGDEVPRAAQVAVAG